MNDSHEAFKLICRPFQMYSPEGTKNVGKIDNQSKKVEKQIGVNGHLVVIHKIYFWRPQ